MKHENEKDPVVAKMNKKGTDIFNNDQQVSEIDIHGIVNRKEMKHDPHFKEDYQ